MARSGAWGGNASGQLGDGSSADRSSPVKIVDSGVIAVAAGRIHSLFIKQDGSLWGMGSNSFGQLGDDTKTSRRIPVKIADAGVNAVAAGGDHSLFVNQDGSLWGIGYNLYGQLGDGSTATRSSPVKIVDSGINAVAAGLRHSLFVKQDGSLWAMGRNKEGQLGDGSTANRSSPVKIVNSGVIAVDAGDGYNLGDSHSLFVKLDGSLWATGKNGAGQFGDGTTISRTSPVRVVGAGVIAVAAGGFHSLFLGAVPPLQEITVVASANATEPSTQGQFTFTRTDDTSHALPVTISVSGTAMPGADYEALPSTISFPVGQATVTLAVTVINDAVVEPLETVILTLQAGTGYTVGTPATATMSIASEDSGITSITPSQTALGMNLLVRGGGFGTRSVVAKLVEAPPSGKRPRRLPLRVVRGSLSADRVTVTVSTGRPGSYYLELKPWGKRTPITSAQQVQLLPPSPESMTASVPLRGEVQITGQFFGKVRGSVTVQPEGSSKRSRLQVARANWDDTTLSGIVPRKLLPGQYVVTVKTRLGETQVPGALTVTP